METGWLDAAVAELEDAGGDGMLEGWLLTVSGCSLARGLVRGTVHAGWKTGNNGVNNRITMNVNSGSFKGFNL